MEVVVLTPLVAVAMALLPLYHCQVTVFAVALSGSVSVAVSSTLTWGCNVSRVIVPDSSTLVTSMVTAFVAVVFAPPSDASTVTVYVLEVPLAPPPVGASKSGELANVSTPLLLILKSPASPPSTSQVIDLPSGSVA